MMQRDFRHTQWYAEAEMLHTRLRQPGSGRISDAAEIHSSPDGRTCVFSGAIVDALEGDVTTRICLADLTTGLARVVTQGPNTDCSPRFSPNGRFVAFLSDRHRAGDLQAYVLCVASGAIQAVPRSQQGWVEYLHWSPDGRRILLGVAGHGADVAGGLGGVTSQQQGVELPPWMPAVEAGRESYRWRSAWTYDVEGASGRLTQLGQSGANVWEAVWCGAASIAAVTSPGPEEGLWYQARLYLTDIEGGRSRELYAPRRQLGCTTGSPSGEYVAVVEGLSSDRGVVAGDLLLIHVVSRVARLVNAAGIDVTHVEWRSDTSLLLAGHRGFETVVATYDLTSNKIREIWSSCEITTGGRYVSVAGLGDRGDCILLGESFAQGPEIAVIKSGRYQPVNIPMLDSAGHDVHIGGVDRVTWLAPDGLEIQGWLLRPRAAPPYPLVTYVHGGPVWHSRPRWIGRAAVHYAMLLRRGYAIFLPNPRGSSGRGQEFATHVLGDMAGADTHDHLSGLDHLAREGIVDPTRIGVAGVSYGGYMTSWLITQDRRFAAAVSVCPMTNLVTQHLVSNIPHFVSLFAKDTYSNPGGGYFDRSPIMHAHHARTPTLNICGALDRCTPPAEAMQFHNALKENGVTSVLVTYPEEGHGVRKFPAVIDYAARTVAWFQNFMPAKC